MVRYGEGVPDWTDPQAACHYWYHVKRFRLATIAAYFRVDISTVSRHVRAAAAKEPAYHLTHGDHTPLASAGITTSTRPPEVALPCAVYFAGCYVQRGIVDLLRTRAEAQRASTTDAMSCAPEEDYAGQDYADAWDFDPWYFHLATGPDKDSAEFPFERDIVRAIMAKTRGRSRCLGQLTDRHYTQEYLFEYRAEFLPANTQVIATSERPVQGTADARCPAVRRGPLSGDSSTGSIISGFGGSREARKPGT